MKDIITRAFSGILFIAVLLTSLLNEHALIAVFFIFGTICLYEFKKLIQLKNSLIPYIIFTVLYLVFSYWKILLPELKGFDESSQILLVLTLFVLLFLIKDLFSEKTIPLFESKRFLLTTFYVTSGFIFIVLITQTTAIFNPKILLGSLILVWVNDSFAYLVGKNFGKQKLFPSVSPKKTVEGFLGGLFFSCIASYFIFNFTETLSFNNWLILAVIVSTIGTIGDLIESKFKRQANVKDSGNIMPGHGGLLDRLDSIVFAAPFIYLFLQILNLMA